MPDTDEQLIEAAKRGDQAAQQQLYQDNIRLLYGYLYRRIGSRTDVEDICQEAFAKAFSKLDQYRGDASFKNWLFQIAKNIVADHWRKQANCRTVSIDEFFEIGHEPLSAEEEKAEAANQREAAKRLSAVLDELPVNYRAILELRFLKGYTIRESAEELNISESNAKVRQYRALKKAQALISDTSQP